MLGLMMPYNRKLPFAAAQISLLVFGLGCYSLAWSAPPINTVNDGRIVAGGTYLNTSNSKTTFTNSQGGGLWVRPNTVVRGLESDSSGNLTNNGGTIQFYAPDNVVRIDGTVNVNGLLNGSGAFIGNGGKVFVDSAYLINNGNIYASGVNGGLVQINVAGMAMNGSGRIYAHGYGGNGGVISVNSSGPVDIRRGAVIDSSGRVSGTIDTNVINLEGSIVNVEGVLRADGVTAAQVGSRGGTIRLVATGRSDLSELQRAFTAAGQTNAGDATSTPTLSAAEQSALTSRAQSLISTEEGSVNIGYRTVSTTGTPTGGWLSVNGSNGPIANNNDQTENTVQRAGDGGTIILAADQNVHIRGLISANGGQGSSGATTSATLQPNPGVNGGDGGTISAISNRDIAVLNTSGQLSGVVQASGGAGGQTTVFNSADVQTNPSAKGGNGGVIAFGYNSAMGNRGTISALGGAGGQGTRLASQASTPAGPGGNGGNGGLIVFSGNDNPIGGGRINDSGGSGGSGLSGPVSAGGHAGLIVTPVPPTLTTTQNVTQRDGAAGNSNGVPGVTRSALGVTAGDELLSHAENLIWLRKNTASNTHPAGISDILFNHQGVARSITDPNGQGTALNLILARKSTSTYPYRNFTVGSSVNNLGLSLARPFPEEWDGLTKVANLTVANHGSITFPGSSDYWRVNAWGGGHISALAMGNIGNNEDGYEADGTVVGGSINLASSQDIVPYSIIGTQALNFHGETAFHDGSIIMKADRDIQNLALLGGSSRNALIGETIRLKAGRNFINQGQSVLAANAGGSTATGPSQAGMITINAGNDLRMGNQIDGGPTMEADGVGSSAAGGYIFMKANTISTPNLNYAQASGTSTPGRIIIQGTVQIDPPM